MSTPPRRQVPALPSHLPVAGVGAPSLPRAAGPSGPAAPPGGGRASIVHYEGGLVPAVRDPQGDRFSAEVLQALPALIGRGSLLRSEAGKFPGCGDVDRAWQPEAGGAVHVRVRLWSPEMIELTDAGRIWAVIGGVIRGYEVEAEGRLITSVGEPFVILTRDPIGGWLPLWRVQGR